MKLSADDFKHLNSFYGQPSARETVYRLYKGVCQGCGKELDGGSSYHLGHIVPRSHAEEFVNWFPGLDVDNLLNLHLLCARCNSKQTNVFLDSPFRLNQLFAQSAAAISRRLSRVSSSKEQLPASGERVRQALEAMGRRAALRAADLPQIPCTPSFYVVPAAAVRAALGTHPFAATLTDPELVAALACGAKSMSVPYRLVEYAGRCSWSPTLSKEAFDELERADDWAARAANGQNARVHVTVALWSGDSIPLVHLTPAEVWAQRALGALLKFREQVVACRSGLYELEYGSTELPEALEPFEWARDAAPAFCTRQMTPEFAHVDAGIDRKKRRLVYERDLAKLPKNLRASAEHLVKTRDTDVGLLAPKRALLRAIDNCLEFGLWAVEHSGGELGIAVEWNPGRSARFPAIPGLEEVVERRFKEGVVVGAPVKRRGRPKKVSADPFAKRPAR